MNNNKEQKRPIGTIIILLAAAGIACFGVIQALKTNKPNRAAQLPFQYNIEKLKEVPKELIKWKQVRMIDPQGHATAIAADNAGQLYVAVDKRIDVLDAAGERTRQVALPASAAALAIGTDGTTYAGLTDHVAVFKADGSLAREWQSMGENGSITSITVGAADVFVADSGNRTVWHYDLNGSLLGSFRGPEQGGFSIPSPYFEVLLHDDVLLIIDPGRHDVGTYDFDFKRKSGWGKAGESITSFAGCCGPSHIAQLPDGALVTAEKGLPRIKVYEPAGKLLDVVAPPTLLNKGPKPCDVAADSQGRIYALDPNMNKIRVFERLKEATK